MRFKERNCYITSKCKVKAASADGEAAASYPEDLNEIINERLMKVTTLNNRFSM